MIVEMRHVSRDTLSILLFIRLVHQNFDRSFQSFSIALTDGKGNTHKVY